MMAKKWRYDNSKRTIRNNQWYNIPISKYIKFVKINRSQLIIVLDVMNGNDD